MTQPSETREALPVVVTLLRFASQGVGLGALTGAIVGALLAGPGMVIGVAVGGVIGWPGGLIAGLGAVLAARTRRSWLVALAGALGAGVVTLPVLSFLGALRGSGLSGWILLAAALVVAAIASPFTLRAVARIEDRRSSIIIGAGIAVLWALVTVGVVAVAHWFASEPYEPPAQSTAVRPTAFPDPDAGISGPIEPAPLDPGASLPPAPLISTELTLAELTVAMRELLDGSLAAVAPINAGDITPAGTAFIVEDCGATAARLTLEFWFATDHNTAALDQMRDYWTASGYSVLTREGEVAAAGRDPLAARALSLTQQEWDEDDLRLQLTSVCAQR